MKFAEGDGRRLKDGHMRKEPVRDKNVVSDLVSEHKGVSDTSLETALGTVKDGGKELFVELLNEINTYCKIKRP